MRACGICGKAIARGRRCRACKIAAPARPVYGADHRRRRKLVGQLVAGGRVRCARGAACKFAELVDGRRLGGFIKRGEAWDLDHRDDGAGYLGATHAICNRAAGSAVREQGGRR